MSIKESKTLAQEALATIQLYQSGDIKPIKTRFEHFNYNCGGGIFPGNVIVIGGTSGHGKTHVLQEIEEDLFNPNLNDSCENTLLLRCNWEMSVQKLILRSISRELKKPIRNILNGKPTSTEQSIIDKVVQRESASHIKYMEEPPTPIMFNKELEDFLTTYANKENIVVTVDHMALIKGGADSKKTPIDELIEYCNSLKKKYKNVSFILLTQLNRKIEERTDPKLHQPNKGDLYQSDTIYQLADIVLVINNPYKTGKEIYMLINTTNEDFAHLLKYVVNPNTKHTNFRTKGLIFWHYLKVREEDETIRHLHVEEMYSQKEKKPKERILPKAEAPSNQEEVDDLPF